MRRERGQIALFVIFALFLVGVIFLIYYAVKGPAMIPSKLAPAEDRVVSCIKSSVEEGTALLGEQGGYIAVPEFEAGSEIFPSTSQLDFFGSTMPFWFYISGNGFQRTQVPSISGMERELDSYVSEQVSQCSFDELTSRGYSMSYEGKPIVKTTIKEDAIIAEVEWPVTISLGETTKRVTSHKVNMESQFGSLYDTAKRIFDKENSEMFFEEYTIDAITLNAPTTDVVLGCAPKIWSKDQVKEDIKGALVANIPSVRFIGSYYKLRNKEEKYFEKDLGKAVTDKQVNIIYDKRLPTAIEIVPSDNDMMRADPVGLQEGMGILGFCYVPYHFVYSINYPVIVQVFDGKFNMFQFPMIVYVKNNQQRNATQYEQPEEFENQLCKYKVQDFEVRTVDKEGKPVDAEVSFKCGGSSCPIGRATDGELKGSFPQCVNGFIVAQKDGYADAKAQVSTNEPGMAEIPMKRMHNLSLVVFADSTMALGKNDTAMISFNSADYSTSVYYPFQKAMQLPEGDYDISSYLFREGKITLSSQSTEKCVSVPKEGFLGFLGFQTDECFTVNMPSQELSQLTVGGGSVKASFDEVELGQSSIMEISIPTHPIPKTVLELQDIYSMIPASAMSVEVK